MQNRVLPAALARLAASTTSATLLLVPASFLLLLLLQFFLPIVAADSTLFPPLPLLNQNVLVQVSLLLSPSPTPIHPIPLDIRFTCASTSAAFTLNSTYTLTSLFTSSLAHVDALSSKQKQAQPAWTFAADRHQLQTLQPCWVTAHTIDTPRQRLGSKVVYPPATAMQLSIVLRIHLPSHTLASSSTFFSSPSSSSFSFSTFYNSWLSKIRQQTYYSRTRLLEILITYYWVKITAKDALVFLSFLGLFIQCCLVIGGVMLALVRRTKEETEENKSPHGQETCTSLASFFYSPLTLASQKCTALTTHPRRVSSNNSSSSNYSHNRHQPPSLTAISSNKKRESNITVSKLAGDSSSFLFLDVPFSSQWQCVTHDCRAAPTLLQDRDLDAVAAAGGSGRKLKGRHHQVIPTPKEVMARLFADDRKVKGMVLSAKS